MKKSNNDKKSIPSSSGWAIGLCLGVAYGIIFDNLVLGIAIGLCFGMLWEKNSEKKDKNSAPDALIKNAGTAGVQKRAAS